MSPQIKSPLLETPETNSLRQELAELRVLIGKDPHGALPLANKLLGKANSIVDLNLKAEIFHVTGLALHSTRKFEQALIWYKEALGIRQDIDDKKGASLSLNNMGLAYHDMGQFEEAIPYYMQAIALKEELKDYKSLTATYENLGVAFEKLSKYKNAMEVYYKSLKISEEMNDHLRMALTYQNMGVVHLYSGNYKNAYEMLEKALNLRKGTADAIPLIQLKINIGFVHVKAKRYKDALNVFNECLKLSQGIEFLPGILTAYNNIGEAFLGLGKNHDALKANMKCYEMAVQHLEYTEQCSSAINIGEIYILIGEFDKAYNYLQTALALSRQIEDKAKERDAYCYLIQVYEKKGQWVEALNSYRQYDTLKSEILNTRNAGDINELKTKYEVEKKEKQVQQAKLLQVESELKALRAQMDPHFIFNALGSMRKELLEGNIENADKYIVRFSRLLRLILDTTRTPVVRLSDNIELLHLYIQIEQARQDNRFEYKINLGKGIRPEEVFVPGLILQPLVENAIIHGLFNKQDGKGKLSISFAKKGDALQIKVSDNGVGRKGSGEKKKEGHKSHATSIIKETLQLSWKDRDVNEVFTIKDRIDKNGNADGTEVIVLLPLSGG